jgi:very-short-patch-repair endonuclease
VLFGFIVDFYYHRAQLVVEVDGATHGASSHQDMLRDDVLRDRGTSILRFSNVEVIRETAVVLDSMKAYAATGQRQ